MALQTFLVASPTSFDVTKRVRRVKKTPRRPRKRLGSSLLQDVHTQVCSLHEADATKLVWLSLKEVPETPGWVRAIQKIKDCELANKTVPQNRSRAPSRRDFFAGTAKTHLQEEKQ